MRSLSPTAESCRGVHDVCEIKKTSEGRIALKWREAIASIYCVSTLEQLEYGSRFGIAFISCMIIRKTTILKTTILLNFGGFVQHKLLFFFKFLMSLHNTVDRN